MSVPNVAATFGEGPDTFWGAWREGDVLVLSKQHHVLPDRCVKCNAPAAGHRWEKRLYWHHPLIYLSLLAGALIYVVIALIARKEAYVSLPVCALHRKRRALGLWIAWGGFLASFVGLFVVAAAATSAPGLFLVPLLGMLAFPITGGILARIAAPKEIDDYVVRLKVGAPFLDAVPPVPPQFHGPGYGYVAPPMGSGPPGMGPPGMGPPGGWAPPHPGWGPPSG